MEKIDENNNLIIRLPTQMYFVHLQFKIGMINILVGTVETGRAPSLREKQTIQYNNLYRRGMPRLYQIDNNR